VTTVVVTSSKDNTLYQTSSKDNTLYQSSSASLSNGAGEYMFVGRTNSGMLRRAVVAFDLTGKVPAGSKVVSGTLTLHMSRSQTGGIRVRLHRLNADWGEAGSRAGGEQGGGAPPETGDVTWTHRFFGGQTWSAPGGDFASAESGAIMVDQIGAYSWSSPQTGSDVQTWVDDPSRNFGWILIGNEANTQTTKRFYTRQFSSEGYRPTLRIEFVAP
jgi:hypothetical protein